MNPSEQSQIKKQNINAVPENKSWIEFVFDESSFAVPVGSRFQAELPALTISSGKHDVGYKSESSKWLGAKVWPTGDANDEINDESSVGRGRPDCCSCVNPESIDCIKIHTADKRIQLQTEVGIAFWKWKFDHMGEDVSKEWNAAEERKFQSTAKMHAKSTGQIFINSALHCLPGQSQENIIRYYYNVHIPRRMSKQSRLGNVKIDTDDETDDTPPPSKGSRKRLQINNDPSSQRKSVKAKNLTDQR